jgi:hypothetical protein
MSYVIPFLPDSARAVRISGSLRMDTKFQLEARVQEIIRQHDGPIRSLSEELPGELEQYDLARFGLRLESSDCATVRTHIDEFISCPLVRDDPRPVLRIDISRRSVLWSFPSDSGARVYVQMDGNPRTVFATGPRGEQEARWISPGHRYRFELFEWDGTSNGRLLATATVDEQGNVQEQRAEN